jgi:hypothetical protein
MRRLPSVAQNLPLFRTGIAARPADNVGLVLAQQKLRNLPGESLMTATHPLPTVFGRLTTVLSEHEHLKDTQEKLVALCAALGAGQSPLPSNLAPARLIAKLRAELSRHFANEETDAHFGAVVRERPELLPRVVELRADHTTMLDLIDGLELIAAEETRWNELIAAIPVFLGQLRMHEQAESALVQEFFSPGDRAS